MREGGYYPVLCLYAPLAQKVFFSQKRNVFLWEVIVIFSTFAAAILGAEITDAPPLKRKITNLNTHQKDLNVIGSIPALKTITVNITDASLIKKSYKKQYKANLITLNKFYNFRSIK